MKTNRYTLLSGLFILFTLIYNCAISQTSLFVSGSKNVYIKSTTLTVNGHITNNGIIDGTSAGVLNMNGTNTQSINGNAVDMTTFGKININNTNGVHLGTNVDVTGTTGVDFLQGPLTLNGFNIRFGTGSSWANNNNSTKFFVTNGSGLVVAANTGSELQYPVGIATGVTNYTPITIANSGTADTYGVRAQSGFGTTYNPDGSPTGTLVNSNVVDVSWIVNEGVAGGSTLSTTLQWNAANETTGFDRNFSIAGVFRFSSGDWMTSPIGGVTNVGSAYAKSFSPALSTFTYQPLTIGNALSPLPVELLGFTVKPVNNLDAALEWSTASETNNDHFEIERSLDGVTFEKIATEKGAGNSTQIIKYDLIDEKAGEKISTGTIYYRLKQVDYDNKYSYSGIQSVFFTSAGSALIYPNPTQGNLTLNYISVYKHEITIRVIDILGAIIKQFKLEVNKGDQDIKLDLSELANGHYKIMLITPSTVSTHKIVVSR